MKKGQNNGKNFKHRYIYLNNKMSSEVINVGIKVSSIADKIHLYLSALAGCLFICIASYLNSPYGIQKKDCTV